MSYVNKVNVAGTLFDIQDIRIDGIDNTAVSGSTNLITSGGVYSSIGTQVAVETNARITEDNNLQTQIDAITSQSDVVDVVGTKADLNSYSKLIYKDDIVKVLSDESRGNVIAYYRAGADSPVYDWTYVGSQGPFYTKSETENIFATKEYAATVGPVTSVNGGTGAITGLATQAYAATVGPVTSVNGGTGAITGLATETYANSHGPVTSVNGSTGAITGLATQAYAATVGPVTSVNGATGAVTTRQLPTCTTADNNKFLRVVNGAAAWVALDSAEAQVF